MNLQSRMELQAAVEELYGGGPGSGPRPGGGHKDMAPVPGIVRQWHKTLSDSQKAMLPQPKGAFDDIINRKQRTDVEADDVEADDEE